MDVDHVLRYGEFMFCMGGVVSGPFWLWLGEWFRVRRSNKTYSQSNKEVKP